MAEVKTLPAKPKYVDPKDASIQAQVAIKKLVDLKIAGVEIPDDLDHAVWWWMRNALKGYCCDFHEMVKNEVKK